MSFSLWAVHKECTSLPGGFLWYVLVEVTCEEAGAKRLFFAVRSLILALPFV